MAIIQLTPRVWHTLPVEAGDRPALGLVAGEKAALLIDGGNSPAHVEELLRADEAIAQRVEQGTEMEFCRQNILIEWPDNKRDIHIPAPAVIFQRELTLDLGGLTARIFWVDSDHSPDCCVIYLVEEKVVFLGDCLYLNMDHEPWFRTPGRTRRLMEQLAALDARWYVPAHHGVYSGEEFQRFAREMTLLCQAAEGADTLEQAEEKLHRLTGRTVSPEDRQGLEEFLNAKAHHI